MSAVMVRNVGLTLRVGVGDGDNLPAVQIYNILRGFKVGDEILFGVNDPQATELITKDWIKYIEKCRQPIVLEDGTIEPQYSSGLEINTCEPVGDAITELLLACAGSFSESFGKFKIFVGAPDEPILHITDGDLLADGKLIFSPFNDTTQNIREVVASYSEPKENWSKKELTITIDKEEGEKKLSYKRKGGANITYKAVHSGYQIKRLLRSFIDESKKSSAHEISLPSKYWHLEPNDVISWTSEYFNYQKKLFRIIYVLHKADLTVELRMIEVDPNHYLPHADDLKPLDYTPDIEHVIIKQSISDFMVFAEVLKDTRGVDVRNGIRIKWDKDVLDVDFVEFEIRESASKKTIHSGRSDRPSQGEIFTSPNALQPLTKYEVRAKYGKYKKTKEFIWSHWEEITTQQIRPISKDLLQKDIKDFITADLAKKQKEDIEEVNNLIEQGAKHFTQKLTDQGAKYEQKIVVVTNATKSLSAKVDNNKTELDGAISQVQDSLINKLEQTNDGLTALARRINSIDLSLGNVDAKGYFRAEATYIKDKAEVRVGLGATLNSNKCNKDIKLHHSIELVVSEQRGNYAVINTDKTVFTNGVGTAYFNLSPKTDNKANAFELKTIVGKTENNLTFTEKKELTFNDEVVSTPIGMISAFAHTKDIGGWMYCNGKSLPKKDYPELYKLIGDDWWDKQSELNRLNENICQEFLTNPANEELDEEIKKYLSLLLANIELFKQKDERNSDSTINNNVSSMSGLSQKLINNNKDKNVVETDLLEVFTRLVSNYIYWEEEYRKVRGSVRYWKNNDGKEPKLSQIREVFSKFQIRAIPWIRDVDYFKLPDLRGSFLRGLDGGRGLDVDRKDRSIGSYQTDELKSHRHDNNYSTGYYAKLSIGSFFGTTGLALHGDGNDRLIRSEYIGGSETRPKNYAVAYHIKVR
ncbi:tail fiber protein [Bartonella sp. DGB1]|uniref:tail fiber protein n=1 Tax=Bartonella sp. DGB1 TaxID=3239807 RepID=UPI003523C532